jgi:hypothetical protein
MCGPFHARRIGTWFATLAVGTGWVWSKRDTLCGAAILMPAAEGSSARSMAAIESTAVHRGFRSGVDLMKPFSDEVNGQNPTW